MLFCNLLYFGVTFPQFGSKLIFCSSTPPTIPLPPPLACGVIALLCVIFWLVLKSYVIAFVLFFKQPSTMFVLNPLVITAYPSLSRYFLCLTFVLVWVCLEGGGGSHLVFLKYSDSHVDAGLQRAWCATPCSSSR